MGGGTQTKGTTVGGVNGLTSGQTGCPQTQDLREQGERVKGMQCKRKHEEKEGRGLW